MRVAYEKTAELLQRGMVHFNDIKRTSSVGGITLHNPVTAFWIAVAAPGRQVAFWCPAPSEEGIQGDVPSTLLWMCRMNPGAGSETGADLCTYNEVEKILFTRILLKDSPEYIWMKKYVSNPLGVEGETQEYIQARKLIINLLCMR